MPCVTGRITRAVCAHGSTVTCRAGLARRLMPLAMLLLLAGCAHWDWRGTGRSWLESLCNSFGNCAVACTPGEPEGWCQ
jgi:hypothetical protein